LAADEKVATSPTKRSNLAGPGLSAADTQQG
jgi:hypothetical protein